MKRYLPILLVLFIVATFSLTVSAASVSSKTPSVSSLFLENAELKTYSIRSTPDLISYVTISIEDNENGTVECTGSQVAYDYSDKLETTVYLQRYYGGSWVNWELIDSVIDYNEIYSFAGDTSSSLPDGTYRTYCIYKCTDDGETETLYEISSSVFIN